MVKFFFMPKEVWFYVIFPILFIIFVYFLFWLFYRKKKDTYYYDYVVDYVYSTLGIVFCSLLLCLLLGYSIATIQTLITTNLIRRYFVLAILLIILPVVPTCFLVYVLKVYIKNLKRKEKLDAALENNEEEQMSFEFGYQNKNELPNEKIYIKKEFDESAFELKKKKR